MNMSRERYSTSYSHTSSRPLIQRVFAGVLVLVALVLLVLARAHNPAVTRIRAQMIDIVSPAVEWVAQPISGIRSLINDKNSLFNAYEENKQLRTENETLRHWQAVAQALKAENDALRTLANYQPVPHASYLSARVTSQSPVGYSSTLTLNTGSVEGVKHLEPVIDAYGLIGRVMDVGEHNASVLLMSDSTSRIPVVTATGRIHAIAAGSGNSDELLRLDFLGGDPASVALGEQVVTTEEGGLIPGGILVGTVFKRDAKGLFVKPVRPFAQSEYVRVVNTN